MAEEPQNNIVVEPPNQTQEEAKCKSPSVKEALLKSQSAQTIQESQKQEKKVLNIFANQEKRDPISLFGSNQSVNLFKIKNQNMPEYHNKSIFNIAKKQIAENQNEGDDLSIASSGTNQSSFRTEPVEKVMRYDYKSQSEKIKDFALKKFKIGANPAVEQIYVCLEKLLNDKEKLCIVVRNNITKVPIFKGIIIKNISKIDHFMEKMDNLRVEVLRKQQNKIIKEIIKMQFCTEEECRQFEKVIQAHFDQ